MKTKLMPHRAIRLRAAFTLIEVLLVVAIIGVVAAITVPSFARSVQGNRLRSAARTVVMAGRYARSMCLLNQQDMTIVFNLKAGRIAVYSTVGQDAAPRDPAGDGGGDAVLGLRPGGSPPAAGGEDVAATGEPGARPAANFGKLEFERELDGVTLTSVVLEDGSKLAHKAKPAGEGKGAEDAVAVPYHSNGTCTPYTVRVVDTDDHAVTIRVDMLSSVQTERE